MKVLRIVADLHADDPKALASFYTDLFDLDVVMDMGWIMTLASEEQMRPQLTMGSGGGSGSALPMLSIEVDDVDAAHSRACALGHEIVYPLTDEPWGVRRFFVHDPAGRKVNVLMHLPD